MPAISSHRTVRAGANRVSIRYRTTTMALSAPISATRIAVKNDTSNARAAWSISHTTISANGGHLTIVVVT